MLQQFEPVLITGSSDKDAQQVKMHAVVMNLHYKAVSYFCAQVYLCVALR